VTGVQTCALPISVIVEWSGKKSDGADLTVTGFSGARVHIGTSSGFTPSADNWVHTLNFANGSNRVSVGVGSIIDKSSGATLQYGTAYHVKLVAVNASGTTSGAFSASNNPVTVARLPASEIDAGILRADAYIQAGADGGQRAVLSGSTSPFIIYGTDGTTKLLEFLTSGTTGTLAIKGSGTFSGDISAASGTFTGNVTTSGNISASNGLFSVNNGLLTAQSGTIGGWTITGSVLESAVVSNNKITLNPATPKIALIQSGVEKITIDPVEGIKDNVGNFTLTPAGILTVKGAITSGSTISGADITMTGAAGQTGIATTKLFFQSSNYAISAGASSYTYQGDSGYYDSEGDWVDTSAPQTISNNDIRFTDATYGGAVPSGTNYYYGELWLGSGSNSAGSVDLWANHPGGFIGVSLVANSDSKNIYVYGDSSAGFTTQHRSSTSDSSKESPAFLQVDSAGRMSRGRAVITGGSSNPSSVLGLTGDLYFSTAT
jgi:hypothetical protein